MIWRRDSIDRHCIRRTRDCTHRRVWRRPVESGLEWRFAMSKFKSGRPTSNRWGNLLLQAAALAALIVPLIASMPAFADARTAADFAVTTCRSIVDDPAKADAMAREQNWTAVAVPQDAVNAKGLKSVSAWMTDRGGGKFTITSGAGSLLDGATSDANVCMVVFPPGTILPRDTFFGVLSAAGLDLEPQTNMTFPQVNMEVFKIKTSGPAIHLLQVTSLHNGNVVAVQMISAPQPDAP
jgi:hypothetical protein